MLLKQNPTGENPESFTARHFHVQKKKACDYNLLTAKRFSGKKTRKNRFSLLRFVPAQSPQKELTPPYCFATT